MSLQHGIDGGPAGFAERKPEHAGLFDATSAKTRRGFSADAALKVGDAVPDFTMLDTLLTTPSDRLHGGPVTMLSTTASSNASLTTLSHVSRAVAHPFGSTHQVAPEERAAMAVMGKVLPLINGDESWIMPLAATCLIGPDRMIPLADLETGCHRRMEPNGVVAKLCPR